MQITMRPWLTVTVLSVPCLLLACGGGDSVSDTSFTTDTLPATTDTSATVTDTADTSSGETGSASNSMTDDSTTDTPDPDTSSGESADTTDGDESSSTGDTGIDACLQVDEPDANGLDENDDGVDGVLCRAVFVSAQVGSDLNDGLAPDDPVATITRGIEIAQMYDPPRMVLVAEANYVETVNVNSGVSLFGGYDAGDWSRDTEANVTEITATENRALIAQNLDLAVEVDGFTIHALDYNNNGQSSYGVWVRDTPEGLFTLDYVTIDAGTGGDGDDGANGDNGQDGGNGSNAVGVTGGGGGTSSCNAVGGSGDDGNGACNENLQTFGEDGSAGGDPTPVGEGGASGADRCGGNIINDCNDSGGNGTQGGFGQVGVNGDGGQSSNDNEGTFGGDGIWIAPVGADPTRGDNGSGGGGGGSGGIDQDPFTCGDADLEGGGGGGGGAGGCGGAFGGSGQPGGGTFAVVVVNSSITMRNVDLDMAEAGDGGDGGVGGDGGSPGGEGSGVDTTSESGDGADGRAGGGGGGGGGGAGGCGGASVGIARVGNSEVGLTNVSFNGGTGGLGGPPGAGGLRPDGLQAEDGDNGCAGFRADQHAY